MPLTLISLKLPPVALIDVRFAPVAVKVPSSSTLKLLPIVIEPPLIVPLKLPPFAYNIPSFVTPKLGPIVNLHIDGPLCPAILRLNTLEDNLTSPSAGASV